MNARPDKNLFNCDYFLTTDNGILKKARLIQNIKIIDPIGFIKEIAI